MSRAVVLKCDGLARMILPSRPRRCFSSRETGESPEVDFSQAVADFRTNGVAILPARASLGFIEKSRRLVMAAWEDALDRARAVRGHEMKVGMNFGFQEFVLRAPGRFDMLWKVDGEEHFVSPDNLDRLRFLPFVHEILGGPSMTQLTFNGCLVSLPGAREQPWHADGEHLFSSEENFMCWGDDKVAFFDKEGAASSILPAHCINVFVPLVDVEGENGGTEFCLGSHFHTKFFNEDIVWQDHTWKDRIGFQGELLQIQVNAGEALAFDYRVLHRALAHGGKEVRPLLYYTFTKRWFQDAMNFSDLPSLREADGK